MCLFFDMDLVEAQNEAKESAFISRFIGKYTDIIDIFCRVGFSGYFIELVWWILLLLLSFFFFLQGKHMCAVERLLSIKVKMAYVFYLIFIDLIPHFVQFSPQPETWFNSNLTEFCMPKIYQSFVISHQIRDSFRKFWCQWILFFSPFFFFKCSLRWEQILLSVAPNNLDTNNSRIAAHLNCRIYI